jgi:hypothetical protein
MAKDIALQKVLSYLKVMFIGWFLRCVKGLFNTLIEVAYYICLSTSKPIMGPGILRGYNCYREP